MSRIIWSTIARTPTVVPAAGMLTTRPSVVIYTRKCRTGVALERLHLERVASARPQRQKILFRHRRSILSVDIANL